MLAVLRSHNLDEARCQLDQLLAAGLVHVELAVRADAAWVAMARELAWQVLLRLMAGRS